MSEDSSAHTESDTDLEESSRIDNKETHLEEKQARELIPAIDQRNAETTSCEDSRATPMESL